MRLGVHLPVAGKGASAGTRLIDHAAPRHRCTSTDLDPIEAPAASKCRCSYRAGAAPPRWQNLLIARQTRGEPEGGALEGRPTGRRDRILALLIHRQRCGPKPCKHL
jgi:hypothetical protein